nr:HNH endonuclease [Halobacillus sp. A5]
MDEYPDIFKKDGVISRCSYIPQWLKQGVFHRDKGRCQICGTDLTKVLNLDNKENYDHIIPLENGGTNDPTNFQLTCESCNKSKGARSNKYNNISSRFWDLENYEMFKG